MLTKTVIYQDRINIAPQVKKTIELIFLLSNTRVKIQTRESDLKTKQAIIDQINIIKTSILISSIEEMIKSDRNDFHRASVTEAIRLNKLRLLPNQFISHLFTIFNQEQLNNGAIAGILYDHASENGILLPIDIEKLLVSRTKHRAVMIRRSTLGTSHGAGHSPEEISRLQQGQIYLIIDSSGKFIRWGASGDIGFQDITRRNIGRKPDENQVFVDLKRNTFQIEVGPATKDPLIQQRINDIAIDLAKKHFPPEYK